MRYRLPTLLIILVPATAAFVYVVVGRMLYGHIAVGGSTVGEDVVGGIMAALIVGSLCALLAGVIGLLKKR
jgi:hypothetical protein